MKLFLRLLKESFVFSFNALIANPVRTVLSLLGVTIGIFTIIAVLSTVDSLEKSIKIIWVSWVLITLELKSGLGTLIIQAMNGGNSLGGRSQHTENMNF